MKSITLIQKESSEGIREYSLSSELLNKGILTILGEINEETLNKFMLEYIYLSMNATKTIKILINSPGGDIESGLAIYDLIQGSKNEIEGYCIGSAKSMAAIIFMGCNKGKRYILPHSQVMIHEPLISNNFGGSATNINNTAKKIMEIKEKINSIISEHTEKDIEVINKITEHDKFFNAQEAIEFGICDKIVTNIF